MQFAVGIPHQGVYTVRICRLGPELRLEVGVVVVDQLRGEEGEAGHRAVDIANCRKGRHTDSVKIFAHDVERSDFSTVSEGCVGDPVLVGDGST